MPVYHDWIEKATHIEADQQALDELKNSWNCQPHDESRGTKRGYDMISDESLTSVNRELLRWAIRQCGDEVSREEVYDAVVRSDGTLGYVMNWLNARRSRFVSVQSNRQSSSSAQSNPLSAVVLPVPTANQFGALSSTDTTEASPSSSAIETVAKPEADGMDIDAESSKAEEVVDEPVVRSSYC